MKSGLVFVRLQTLCLEITAKEKKWETLEFFRDLNCSPFVVNKTVLLENSREKGVHVCR